EWLVSRLYVPPHGERSMFGGYVLHDDLRVYWEAVETLARTAPDCLEGIELPGPDGRMTGFREALFEHYIVDSRADEAQGYQTGKFFELLVSDPKLAEHSGERLLEAAAQGRFEAAERRRLRALPPQALAPETAQ